MKHVKKIIQIVSPWPKFQNKNLFLDGFAVLCGFILKVVSKKIVVVAVPAITFAFQGGSVKKGRKNICPQFEESS